MRDIEKVVVHCSASDEPHQDSIEAIRELHTSNKPIKWGKYDTFGRSWSDIGYHFVITKDGKLHIGRQIHRVGAHCKGHNNNSIGVCLTGNRKFTKEQFDTLEKLLIELIVQFGISVSNIREHSYYDNNKTCPNFIIHDKLRELNELRRLKEWKNY